MHFIIFGIDGDLSRRRLLPALYALFTAGHLPDFRLTGYSLAPITKTALLADIPAANFGKQTPEQWTAFTAAISLKKLDITQKQDWKNQSGQALSPRTETTNSIFYLALPPDVFMACLTGIAAHFPINPATTKIILEKPYGLNLASARQINTALNRLVPAHHIYRLDHFLGKAGMRQAQRFITTNPHLAPYWSGRFIEKIVITLHEITGIGKRAAFYDKTGALVDMLHSHGLQILALMTLGQSDPERIAGKKAALLDRLHPLSQDLNPQIRYGQYKGYQQEHPALKHSRTESFIALTCGLDSPVWAGVPITISTGKKLPRRHFQAKIFFRENQVKDQKGCFIRTIDFDLSQNGGILFCDPQGTVLSSEPPDTSLMPDYQTLLTEIIRGERQYFVTFAEITAAWCWIDDIKAIPPDRLPPTILYPAGTYPDITAHDEKKA